MIETLRDIDGNIVPTQDNIYTLGVTGKRWKDVYVGPGSLHIGNVTLGASGEGVNSQLTIDSHLVLTKGIILGAQVQRSDTAPEGTIWYKSSDKKLYIDNTQVIPNNTYNDNYFSKYFFDQPPAPIFDFSGSTKEQIYIGWTNTTQVQFGFLPDKLPYIKTMYVDLISGTSTTNMIQSAQSPPYVSPPSVSTLIVQKGSGTSGIESRTINSKIYANTYVWYTGTISGPFSIEVWYTNYSEQAPTKLIIANLNFAP